MLLPAQSLYFCVVGQPLHLGPPASLNFLSLAAYAPLSLIQIEEPLPEWKGILRSGRGRQVSCRSLPDSSPELPVQGASLQNLGTLSWKEYIQLFTLKLKGKDQWMHKTM